MNVFKLCVAIVSLLTIVSCSNEDLGSVSMPDQNPETKSVNNSVELPFVAELLASIEIDQSVMNEVKSGVERSLLYGLDEEYRFTDMLKTSSSKLQRSFRSSLLVQKMNDVLSTQQEKFKSDISAIDFFNTLSDNDIQIYWPFSKNWDGHTLPILSCAVNNDELVRFQRGMDGCVVIDTIKNTDEYLKNNTVWIVSINETPYDELPNFENEEYINKDGVFFYSEKAKEWLNKSNEKQRGGEAYGSLPVYIGEVTVYEEDGSGGPEVYFMWGHVSGGVAGVPATGVVNAYRLNLSKDEVKIPKKIDLMIQPRWSSNEKTNALIILEKDGGKDKKATRDLTFTPFLESKEITVPVVFKYERRDEWLYDGIFERSKIFSSANKGSDGLYKQYHGDGIYFTLPTPGFTE